MMRCEAELCRNWAGNAGCPCLVLGLNPDVAEDELTPVVLVPVDESEDEW